LYTINRGLDCADCAGGFPFFEHGGQVRR
jgi:hypothetical protein